MRLLRTLPLLLALFAPLAMAGPYQVEVLFFRQAGEVIPASQLAPEDWAMGSQPVTAESQRSTALNDAAAKLIPANGYKVLLHIEDYAGEHVPTLSVAAAAPSAIPADYRTR